MYVITGCALGVKEELVEMSRRLGKLDSLESRASVSSRSEGSITMCKQLLGLDTGRERMFCSIGPRFKPVCSSPRCGCYQVRLST